MYQINVTDLNYITNYNFEEFIIILLIFYVG
jgi:hypothetical protein